ncbi:MAG: hypothetical protein H7Y36_10700 [Armatimonadetes bacterium]|nr:hypothetical protein [Akkermansiaceae bacterium]
MDLPCSRQIAAWKAMTPTGKLELLIATIRQSRELKRSGLRASFPQASPAEIESKLARVWLHARP